MNRSRTAHDLLTQLCLEKDADIVLISEQYRDRDGTGWHSDELGTAAIWIPDPRRFTVERRGTGRGFVWVGSGDVTYVSCYFTLNERIGDFQEKLDGLEDAVRDMSCEVIVAGDFNAKAVEWGMEPDSRGRRVMEMVSRLGLVVLNSGQTSTIRRPGYRQTIVDISFSTEALEARVHDWRVIEDYTGSDHQYITYSVRHRAPRRVYAAQPRYHWRADRADHEALFHALELGKPSLESIPRGTDPRKKAELLASQTMAHIQRACELSVPRVRIGHRRPVYWWTAEIAALRGRCLRL
ncbi:uncharacterized protein LOC143306153 [Osmia lignaria lignaria]|uniref:uncharacterized protein LOC143306153 n=1 Tax=Osmia lignaria lignaria TaxID=1437193 RepID=UPI00402B392E